MPTEKQRISFKDILHQLSNDLIGKDSFRGVSLTYSWLANQFGHFSLGFIPTLLVHALLKHIPGSSQISIRAFEYVSLFWFLFESYNLLGPLLLKRRTRSALMYIPGKRFEFKPSWGNLIFDTLTDLLFFWLGACCASLGLMFHVHVMMVLIVLIVLVIFPSYYWYLTKMYMQSARYPFQQRLTQCHAVVSDADKKVIKDFIKVKNHTQHLFIFGSSKSDKTMLSVAIGTEKSIRHLPCTYTTAIKLFGMFAESEDELLVKTNLWTWRTSSLLIVDDINPGAPIQEVISTHKFISILNDSPNRELNRTSLCNKSIVWAMGEEKFTKEQFDPWQQMLIDIGVPIGNIKSIDLQKIKTPR